MSKVEYTHLNSYNRIAPYYDRLAGVVFGKSIRESQCVYLSAIPSTARVLIIGGGTGWILEELLRRRPDSLVWYLEASSEMIRLTQERINDINHVVTFIHGEESSIPSDVRFDVVIANFFFDQFEDEGVRRMVMLLQNALMTDGILLVTDFQNTRPWMRVLLKVMYIFFGGVGAINTRKLPSWADNIRLCGFVCEDEASFFHGFIRSMLFRKKAK